MKDTTIISGNYTLKGYTDQNNLIFGAEPVKRRIRFSQISGIEQNAVYSWKIKDSIDSSIRPLSLWCIYDPQTNINNSKDVILSLYRDNVFQWQIKIQGNFFNTLGNSFYWEFPEIEVEEVFEIRAKCDFNGNGLIILCEPTAKTLNFPAVRLS